MKDLKVSRVFWKNFLVVEMEDLRSIGIGINSSGGDENGEVCLSVHYKGYDRRSL